MRITKTPSSRRVHDYSIHLTIGEMEGYLNAETPELERQVRRLIMLTLEREYKRGNASSKPGA